MHQLKASFGLADRLNWKGPDSSQPTVAGHLAVERSPDVEPVVLEGEPRDLLQVEPAAELAQISAIIITEAATSGIGW